MVREKIAVMQRSHCLLGSSGVGKTTLINRLIGQDAFDTKAVSGTGEGIHTTARRQLIVLNQGSMLVDTPGMRELGLLGVGEGVDQGFQEIFRLSLDCRYPNCGHAQEPGCAVRAAVTSGELNEDRYSSYMKLKQESEYHELSYLDKRKKDRAFGRFIKSAKKQMKDRKGTEQRAADFAAPLDSTESLSAHQNSKRYFHATNRSCLWNSQISS